MSTWIAGTYIDNFCAALAQRQGMAGVQICTAPIPVDRVQREALAVIGIKPSTEEIASTGPRTDSRATEDVFLLEGVLQVRLMGSGEADAVACRHRCLDLFDEVISAVREDYDFGINQGVGGANQIISALMSSKALDQGVTAEYRVCAIEFEIRVEARS